MSLALKKGLFTLISPQRQKNTVNCYQIQNVGLYAEAEKLTRKGGGTGMSGKITDLEIDILERSSLLYAED